MFTYIIGFLAFLVAYKEIKFFVIRKRVKGPAAIIKGTEPFFYRKGKMGVLLIHGFTSSPAELREIGEYLKSKNITCYCPLLPGHGTTPERLSLVKWYEWIESLHDSMELLKEHCDKIYIVGTSFGGNLTLCIADKYKEVSGIAVLGTPIKFRKEKLGKTIFLILKSIKLFQRKYYPKSYRENPLLREHFSYSYVPLKAINQVLKIIKESKKNLPNIKCPALIVNSEVDELVDKKSPEIIKNTIKSKFKRIFWVPESYHVVLVDKNKDLVMNEILKFVQQTKNLKTKIAR